MLSGLVTKMANHTETLSLLARDESKLYAIQKKLSAQTHINPLSTDYYDIESLFIKIHESIVEHGPVDLVIGWVHSPAIQATPLIASVIANSSPGPVRYFDVRGSAITLPHRPEDRRIKMVEPFDGIDYRRVILGFKKLNGKSVWLTNEEISDGVFAAIDADASEYIVGQVSPWENSPYYAESILADLD